MDELMPVSVFEDDKLLLKLSREIAADINDLETILKHHSIDAYRWELLRKNARFQQLLSNAIEEWHAAANTHERVKLKAASMIEEVLPDLYKRLIDKGEHLGQQVEGLKWLRDLAGLGPRAGGGGTQGERFTVTINLGADHRVKIEKDITPPVIEGELA
jgi:hypothetical protein